jgi:hypothetical protein
MPIYPGKLSTSFAGLALAIAEWKVAQLYIAQVLNCRPSQESQLFPRNGLRQVQEAHSNQVQQTWIHPKSFLTPLFYVVGLRPELIRAAKRLRLE